MNAPEKMTFIGHVAELAPDGVKQVVLDGREPLAMVRLGDECFVIDDTCTHGQASLSDGHILDGEIVCPFHSGTFDVRTGAATGFPCTDALTVYPVRIEAGEVFALLDVVAVPVDDAR